jgi:hypothetical protein
MIEVYCYDILNEYPIIGATNSPHLSHYYFTTKDKDGSLDAYILVREGESRKYRAFNKWKILYKKAKFSIINDIPVFMYIVPKSVAFKKPILTWIGIYKEDTFYKSPDYNGPEELVDFVVNYLKGNENFTL